MAQIQYNYANETVQAGTRGLEYGADEYVTKPFQMAELMARLRTVQRLAMTRRKLAEMNDQLARQVSEKTRRLNILYRLARRLNEVESEREALDLTVNTQTAILTLEIAIFDTLRREVTLDPAGGVQVRN